MEDMYYDYTCMNDFCTCHRMYFIKYILNKVPATIKTAPGFGQSFHKVLSRWYGNPQMSLAERTRYAISAFDDWIDQEYDPLRTRGRAIEIFSKYIDRYPRETFEIKANEIPVESLLYEDANYCFWLIGKIDLLVSMFDFLYGVDHKTTSQLGDSYFKHYDLSMQMTGYTWYLRKTYGDSVQGMLINAISTAKTAGTGKVKAFDRALTCRTTTDLKLYERTTVPIMMDITKRTVRYKECPTPETRDIQFYPNYNSCTNYGSCDYRELCLQHVSESYLQEKFIERIWDPRAIDE